MEGTGGDWKGLNPQQIKIPLSILNPLQTEQSEKSSDGVINVEHGSNSDPVSEMVDGDDVMRMSNSW